MVIFKSTTQCEGSIFQFAFFAHFGRGLCWDGGSGVWGHDGGDPGVATYFGFSPEENLGIIVFFNAGQFSDKSNEMVLALYEAARQAP